MVEEEEEEEGFKTMEPPMTLQAPLNILVRLVQSMST